MTPGTDLSFSPGKKRPLPLTGKRLGLEFCARRRLTAAIIVVIAPDRPVVLVPIAGGDEPVMVAIDVAISITVIGHHDWRRTAIIGDHDGRFADRRRDGNLRLIAIPRRNHDRRWSSDHQPGRGRKRETEP